MMTMMIFNFCHHSSALAGPYASMLLDVTPLVIAEQITMFDSHLIAKVHPVEFLNYFFPKAYHGTGEPTPNLKV